MRDVRYKQLPAMGPGEGPWGYAPLDQFLVGIPAFSYALKIFNVIPPMHVINEVLARGVDDAGMGGGAKWKPFEISEEEYIELVETLLTNPNLSVVEDRELGEKPNYMKWHSGLLSKYGKNVRN